MTANFKKRMLTDYTVSHIAPDDTGEASDSTTVRQDISTSETPQKRLRLTARTLHLDTRDASDTVQARAAVADLRLQTEALAENFVSIPPADLLDATEKLRDLYVQFKEPEFRCNTLQTIGQLLALPNATVCLTPLRPFLEGVLADDHGLATRTVLLRVLLQAGAAHQGDRAFTCHIAAIVGKCIKDLQLLNRPVLVAGCLDVVGELIEFRGVSRRYILALWNKFAADGSNEVRASAFRMMRNLGNRGFLLDFKMYKSICVGLEDLCVSVRSCAMDLIFRLGQSDKARQVQTGQGTGDTINLVDDVFCKICDRINDWEIEIRAKAAQLLGMMDGVTIDYVNQTVDKKLMSDLRVKVAGHERQKQLFESGEWSSGRKWADDAPKERLQQEDVKLMSIGATGAFVLALEDQFQEVRAPAVISMAQLAAKHPSFGSTCAEFLVDMFNDEIHDVRLNALKMFPLLGQGVDLREDQLEMVLTVLQDADLDIREGLRLILPTLKYSSAKILRMVFDALLTNFHQYPSDHAYICTCLASLGFKNAGFVAEEANAYLNIHPFLQSVEPKSEDKVYIATMTLICNAAAVCAEIFKLFRDFHFRHYLLYHYKYPDWFPLLESVGNAALALKLRQKPDGMSGTGLVARLAALRRSVASSSDLSLISELLLTVGGNLHTICEQDTVLDTTKSWLELEFQFAARYVRCLKRYEDIPKKSLPIVGAIGEGVRVQTDEMRTRFVGHTAEDQEIVSELCLREKLLEALVSAERCGGLIELDPLLLNELITMNKSKVGSWIGSLSDQPRIPEQILFTVLRANIPIPQLASVSVKKLKVDIKSPGNNEEYPVNIVVGTIHRIPFEAVIDGADTDDAAISGMAICIVMPDDRRLLLAVTAKDCLHQNNQLLVRKDIAISLSVWTASAALKIHFCRIIAGKSLQVAGNYHLVQEEDLRKVIVLAGPVAYHVAPVAARSR
ncbi:Integrator complex subunit 4 [Hypsibius exemplaris]|uniref:Integrator complex subunit 4 n=1 Tax=Hypsibius exemplaris TaxID=2072580 RepID=A0A9X6NEE0_HYPEX|nr:Integrator complex subunit 4 [Hypsibius exemplaris]